MGWYIGKEEESVEKEMKAHGLLPGRKISFEPRFFARTAKNYPESTEVLHSIQSLSIKLEQIYPVQNKKQEE